MENKSNNKDIKAEILRKIVAGQVKMKPKYYFILKVIGLFVMVFLTLIVSSLLFSYIVFSVSVSGRMLLLGFGVRGIISFIMLFPWFIMFIDLILLAVLDRLLRQFSFGYRVPFANLFVGTCAVAVAFGFLIDATPFHPYLLRKAEDSSPLPVLTQLYKNVRHPPRSLGIYRGTVLSVATSSFQILHDDHDKDKDDGTETVILPSGFSTFEMIRTGEHVFVAGSEIDTKTIRAYGISKLVNDLETSIKDEIKKNGKRMK